MSARFVALLVLPCLALAACGTDEPPAPRWTHDVRELESLPRDRPVHLWLEGDGIRSVFVGQVEAGVALVVDGKTWKGYPSMPATWGHAGSDVAPNAGGPAVFFGGGGRTIGHVARTETGVAFVIDNVEGPTYDRVWPLVFAPDGRRHAYVAREGEKTVVVLDGEEHAVVGQVRAEGWGGWPTLRFSADGKHFGFIEMGREADGTTVERAWVDGTAGPWFTKVQHLVLAPRGGDHAYVAVGPKDGMHRVMRKGRTGPAFDRVGRLVFDPAGERLAYYGHGEDHAGLMIDNVPQAKERTDIVGAPVFSPDGTHIAYVESSAGGWRAVVDGTPGKTYARIGSLRFAPDGVTPVYFAHDGETSRPVLGTLEGHAAAHSWPVQFSADGTRHAYRQMIDRHSIMVIDGKATSVGALWAGDPIFGPSGRSVAYVAHDDETGFRMILDGEAGPRFDFIEPLQGSFRMEKPSSKPGVFPVSGYDAGSGAAHHHAQFADDDTVRYLARRDGRYYAIEATRK